MNLIQSFSFHEKKQDKKTGYKKIEWLGLSVILPVPADPYCPEKEEMV